MAHERSRQLRTIWMAMLLAIAFYWLIKIRVTSRASSVEWPAFLPVMLMALAAGDYLLGWWWYQRMVGQASKQLTATALHQLPAAERQQLADRVFSSVIACFACLEMPVLLGLINSFGRSTYPRLFEALALTSLAGLIFFRVALLPGIERIFQLLETSA